MDKIELMLKEKNLEETKTELHELELKVASINGPENFNLLDEPAFSELLMRTDSIAKSAAEFDCHLLIPVPSPAKQGVSEETAITQTATALSQMADRYGDSFKLGLEFLGMQSCSINNLNAALQTIKIVNRPNVGLVLDSFHMFLSDSKFSNIAKANPEHIFLVHVNDAEPGERSSLTDANRLYPGEGVIDLKAFLMALNKVGYDDYLSLELLRPAYWEEPPGKVGLKGRESLRRVFGI